MPAEPKEPRTAAGKAAETRLPHFDTCAGMRGPNPCDCGVVEHILAIEAEATRTALEGVAERVRKMPAAAGERRRWVLEQDVLALLTPAKEDGK